MPKLTFKQLVSIFLIIVVIVFSLIGVVDVLEAKRPRPNKDSLSCYPMAECTNKNDAEVTCKHHCEAFGMTAQGCKGVPGKNNEKKRCVCCHDEAQPLRIDPMNLMKGKKGGEDHKVDPHLDGAEEYEGYL